MARADQRVQGTLDPGAGLEERIVHLPDGRRIRTVVAGTGPGPLVVFEAGMSAPAAEWTAVQRAVSAQNRTLSYDRSGYGGSDADDHDRTLDRMAEDLAALLTAVQATEPVVLVAHSWGGPIIRVFAHRHPDLVAGIVLVDASLSTTATRAQAILGALSFRATSLLVRFGGASLIERMVLPHGHSAELSDADMAILLRDYASPRAMRAGVREAKHILSARAPLAALELAGLPDVPIIALQGGRMDGGRATQRFRTEFNHAAGRLIGRHPHGRMVIVEDSGHLIPQEQPGAVVDAILEVAGARDDSPPAAR